MNPYPFGSDGNPVVPGEPLCNASTQYGPMWMGDFVADTAGNVCYLQVSSMAFRAWNRGLAATGWPSLNPGTGTVAYGVWLFNGANWFPDPTFPGSSACPGSTILWAGKLDYWLIGSSANPQRTLCRFDGVNLVWEPLPLPAASVARLSVDSLGNPQGGITSGACYAWDNCWFFGDSGIEVHWDGQVLSDASPGPGASPWLEGDFTGAVAGTDASGQAFGLAVAKTSTATGAGPVKTPSQPDGSPPVQLWGSQGGPWAPLPYSPPAAGQPGDPFTTDLTMASADSQGDAWVAGDPSARLTRSVTAPAPLARLTETGAAVSCPGYGPNTFTLTGGHQGYTWTGLSSFPDGSALAGVNYQNSSIVFNDPLFLGGRSDVEPAIVDARCGQPPTVTELRRPDPLVANQANAPLIPADYAGYATAVAGNAPNDAWAATTDGKWSGYNSNGNLLGGSLQPHVYRWTDGQPPAAPAGDDNEPRPSLFTLDPPVYQVGSPTIVVTQGTQTTTTNKHKPTKVRLPAAIYAIQKPKLRRSPNGTLTLTLTFKVRRAVTIGLEGLQGRKVVASTGLKHFTGHTGQLVLTLNPRHWPTHLSFVNPKPRAKV